MVKITKKFGMTYGQSATEEHLNRVAVVLATQGLIKTPSECRDEIDKNFQEGWRLTCSGEGNNKSQQLVQRVTSEKTRNRLRAKLGLKNS